MMARARNIKPAYFKNEHLAQLSPHARLLFAGLWTLADRRGRLEDRPLRIKAEVFPYESVDVVSLLDELVSSPERFVIRYEVGGQAYLQVQNFHKHQNPHKSERESQIPPCPPNLFRGTSEEAPNLHGASTVLVPLNNGSRPADSLLPITDSLKQIPADDACSDERFLGVGKLGADYLLGLNHPNLGGIAWVPGFLAIRCKALEAERPDLSPEDILACWRDACDVGASKDALNPGFLKSVFETRLTKRQAAKTEPPTATEVRTPSDERSELAALIDELMTHPVIYHRLNPEDTLETTQLNRPQPWMLRCGALTLDPRDWRGEPAHA